MGAQKRLVNIPKNTISVIGVNQQWETEIKVKVTSGNNRTLWFHITCFCLTAQNTFTPAGKGGEVQGRQRDYYPQVVHTVY